MVFQTQTLSRRTLLVEPDPARRRWLATGIGPRAGEIVPVSYAWEALMDLANEAWDLVVVGPHALDVPPVAFVAMVRTAGLETPFLVVLPFPDAQAAGTLRRMQPLNVVADWTDGVALRTSCEALVRQEVVQPEPEAVAGRLRAAASQRRRIVEARQDDADY